MCGIFGFFGFKNPGLLQKMGDSISHRGPDGEGFFQHENFSMGMRRLSIIDLHSGNQPIFNETGEIAICYNGEIYNYLELRKILIDLGHQFKTHSDTEVIVHAYEQWGIDCLQRFNGMFAFSLFDKATKKLFIARDRCGQKPLYYYHQNNKFIFSSEIKAILQADFVPRETNVTSIDAYLTLRYVPEPKTLFKNIFTLPASHYLLLDENNHIQIKRYWDISLVQGNQFLSADQAFDQVKHQLSESVNLVMRSDVPVGAYLSAGIDSSLLVALMREKHSNINTYSIGFNSDIDETKEARETAKLLGTNHHETFCGKSDLGLLPKIIYHMDRPIGDALIIAFYKLAELAGNDLKVVISGEGADEIFAGYQFHKVMQIFQAYTQMVPGFVHKNIVVNLFKLMPSSVLNKFFHFPDSLGSEGKRNLIAFLDNYRDNSLFANYLSLKTLWRQEARYELYTDSFKHLATDEWFPQVRDSSGKFLDRLLKLQWDEWLQDWAIIRQDKNAMAHSLEVRLPFLDHNLIELGFKIPPKYKATWFKDKIIERKLARQLLPKEIINRRKKPFYFPLKHFFNDPKFKDLIKLTLNKEQILKRGYFKPEYIRTLLQKMESGEFLYLKQVVSLVILELWHMVFIDKQIFD